MGWADHADDTATLIASMLDVVVVRGGDVLGQARGTD
jgi:hypothetical protein